MIYSLINNYIQPVINYGELFINNCLSRLMIWERLPGLMILCLIYMQLKSGVVCASGFINFG